MIGDMLKITWEDACFDSGWYDVSKTKRYEQLLTESIGFNIKETEDCIILGTDRWANEDGETQYRHITTIPRKMITKITELKEQAE